MAYLVGIVLATSICALATIVGFDRDRAFYPTVTIVIASYYGLFAVMGGSTRALLQESIVVAAFLLIAIVGFKRNLWLIVVALAAHGLFDFIHGNVIADPGVPGWWPAFCLSYDLVTAAFLGVLLLRRKIAASAPVRR
jgi:hypothetical protein